jgi:hypothetical protein
VTTALENERIAKLEVLVQHIDNRQIDMSEKVDNMHDILQQVKGAKWVGLVLAGFIGFVVSKADILISYIMQGRP